MDEFFGLIFRVFWYFISDIVFMTVCYWVGWPVCKILTLGRYPPKGQVSYCEHSDSEDGWLCSVVGLLVILILAYFLFVH